MKINPKVSVIMAEYNTDPTALVESIASILNQNFKDFEFIIVDDCGKNNLSKIVSTFNDKRLKTIKNPKNMGLVYSLNAAIKQSRGDYIVRMDTDDIALPDRINTIYDFIKKHPLYSVVGSLAVEFSNDKTNGVLGKSGEKTSKSIMRGDSIIHPSVIMNKNAIASLGGYKNHKRSEDLALWCEMLIKNHRLFVIDKVLLKYRLNDTDYKKTTIVQQGW